MTVLEPGPGMGFFTIELTRLVGPSGRVAAVDLQPRMLASLKRRVARRGLADVLDARLASSESMGVADLTGLVDFVLAFAVVHEFPSAERFFEETAAALKPGGMLLFAEPAGHVKPPKFAEELQAAERAGLRVSSRPAIPRSHAAVLQRELSSGL